MKTLASELQRLRNLHNEAAFPQVMEDMMHLMERQARLLDAARDGFEYYYDGNSINAKAREMLKLLDPFQPMSEE